MMQTSKRRISIFPLFKTEAGAIQTKPANNAETSLPAVTPATSCEQPVPPVITARGKRFAIHQIGSMFGGD